LYSSNCFCGLAQSKGILSGGSNAGKKATGGGTFCPQCNNKKKNKKKEVEYVYTLKTRRDERGYQGRRSPRIYKK
jgi:hypothetical protein